MTLEHGGSSFYSGETTFFLLSGIVVGVPVSLFFENIADQWFTTIGVATVVAPFVEEYAKGSLLFFRYERRGRALVTLGLLSGLGFGLAEAALCLYLGAAFILRLPAIFAHAAMTLIVAYGVHARRTAAYYSLAVVFHFLHNLLAALGTLTPSFGVTLVSYITAAILYQRAR